MAQKNLNAILALAQDAKNQLRMEKMSVENYGRDVYRLEYIEDRLQNIINECESTIENNQEKPA